MTETSKTIKTANDSTITLHQPGDQIEIELEESENGNYAYGLLSIEQAKALLAELAVKIAHAEIARTAGA